MYKPFGGLWSSLYVCMDALEPSLPRDILHFHGAPTSKLTTFTRFLNGITNVSEQFSSLGLVFYVTNKIMPLF